MPMTLSRKFTPSKMKHKLNYNYVSCQNYMPFIKMVKCNKQLAHQLHYIHILINLYICEVKLCAVFGKYVCVCVPHSRHLLVYLLVFFCILSNAFNDQLTHIHHSIRLSIDHKIHLLYWMKSIKIIKKSTCADMAFDSGNSHAHFNSIPY